MEEINLNQNRHTFGIRMKIMMFDETLNTYKIDKKGIIRQGV